MKAEFLPYRPRALPARTAAIIARCRSCTTSRAFAAFARAAAGSVASASTAFVRRALAGGVEDGLKADEGGVVFLREAGDDFLPLPDAGGPRFVAVLPFAHGQSEGGAEDEADGGVGGAGVGEQAVVGLLELVERDAAAVVVDADEDAEDAGPLVEGVHLPALGEVEDGVAAAAAVEKVKFRSAKAAPYFAAMMKA